MRCLCERPGRFGLLSLQLFLPRWCPRRQWVAPPRPGRVMCESVRECVRVCGCFSLPAIPFLLPKFFRARSCKGDTDTRNMVCKKEASLIPFPHKQQQQQPPVVLAVVVVVRRKNGNGDGDDGDVAKRGTKHQVPSISSNHFQHRQKQHKSMLRASKIHITTYSTLSIAWTDQARDREIPARRPTFHLHLASSATFNL